MNKGAVELTATDRGAAKRLHIRTQETIMDEYYMILIYDMMQNYAISSGINGVYENPAYQTYVYYYDTSKNQQNMGLNGPAPGKYARTPM